MSPSNFVMEGFYQDEKGRENKCPVILDTDDALKKAKYEHLGMKTVRTRKIADNSFMYDLVWESEESAGTAEPSWMLLHQGSR